MRRAPPVVDLRADGIAVLEALYADEPDPGRWARAALGALERVVAAPFGTAVTEVVHGDDLQRPRLAFAAVTSSALADVEDTLDALFAQASSELFRAAFFPGRPADCHSRIASAHPRAIGQALAGFRAHIGAGDALGIFAYPRPGAVVLVSCPSVGPVALSRAERHVLERLASHLDSAFRLRHDPARAIAAVVAPSGRVLDVAGAELVGGAGLAERSQRLTIGGHVVALERSRLHARRREAEALDHWQALVAGRYSIVPHEDRDGRRCYLLVVNRAVAPPHARWSPRECDVVRMAARGFTGKGTAYALGLSAPAVSTTLARAARKVGIASRQGLIEVATALFGAPTPTDLSALTPAERDVLELLRRGLSNAAIARLRQRSSRTIANQVAAVLRKTGRPSRRALFGPDVDAPA